MKAVILCEDKDLKSTPLTENKPAALLKIAGVTVIDNIIRQLKRAKINDITLALGHYAHKIISAVDYKYNDVAIHYTKNCISGTANAILNSFKNDDMIVIEANSIFDFDLKRIYNSHMLNKALCTVVSKKINDLSSGTSFCIDCANKVTAVINDPSADNSCANNAFTGVCVLSKEILEQYDFSDNSDFINDILSVAVSENKSIMLYEETGYWQKLNSAENYLKCQQDTLNGISGIDVNTKIKKNKIYSDTDSNFNGVSIVPPVYIGSNVTIKPGAIIRPYTVIDDNSVISEKTDISFSYIGENCEIKKNAVITSSVVCNDVTIGHNAKCSKNTVIGNNVRIGNNAKIKENVRIFSDNAIGDSQVVSKDVKKHLTTPLLIDEEGEISFRNTNHLPINIARTGMAIGTAKDKSQTVLVGYSDSPSSKSLSLAFISGLLSTGVNVYDISECTHQQVMYAGNLTNSSVCCYIQTDYYTKIIISQAGGIPLSSDIQSRIENNYNDKSFRNTHINDIGELRHLSGTAGLYKEHLESLLPDRLVSINADIRCNNICQAKLADSIFQSRNDIDGEHIVFHISSDGCSCSAYTDKTGYVCHERLMLLAIGICAENGIPVSLPYYFPYEADSFAEKIGAKLYRYNNFNANNIQNNTAKRQDNLFVRDSIMLCCMICNYLSCNGISLSEALNDIPDFSSVQRYITVYNSSGNALNRIFNDNSKGMIEYSNTNSRAKIKQLKAANGIMVFAESYKAEFASAICDEIQEKIKKFENQQ